VSLTQRLLTGAQTFTNQESSFSKSKGLVHLNGDEPFLHAGRKLLFRLGRRGTVAIASGHYKWLASG